MQYTIAAHNHAHTTQTEYREVQYTVPMYRSAVVRHVIAFFARLGTAAGLIAAANWLFDYPFSGWVIWQFGPLVGGVAILISAPVLNYGIVHWYRKTTADWFGMEWLRAQEQIRSETWSGKLVRAALGKSRLLAFTAVSGLLDPVYGFIYQRGRITGTRFTAQDWWWFGLANAIGVLPWIMGTSIVVETAKISIQ